MTQDVQPGQTVYVTKYALTEGVFEVRPMAFWDDGSIHAGMPERRAYEVYKPGEWYPSREVSIARAEYMRDAKIAEHESEIARLRGMTW